MVVEAKEEAAIDVAGDGFAVYGEGNLGHLTALAADTACQICEGVIGMAMWFTP